MKNLIQLLENTIGGVKVTPAVQGAIEVKVGDPGDIAAVVATVADAIQDYDLGDVQITTNSVRGTVYINPVDEEEYDNDPEEPEEEEPDGTGHRNLSGRASGSVRAEE